MQVLNFILRVVQFVWVIILTGLIGNVIARNVDAATSAVAAVNFTMFVIAWTWLSVLYGLGFSIIEQITLPMAVLFLDGTAAVLTLTNGIVLAAKLGAPNCSNIHGYGPAWIAFGSNDDERRCRELQASTFFMWMLWATTSACLAFFIVGWRRAGGSVSASAPHMAQVRA